MPRAHPEFDSELQKLLPLLQNGDRDAGHRALEAVRPLVRHRLERLGARNNFPDVDTDDLVQETQAAASRALVASRFDSPRAFRAWIVKIATNKLRDQLRSQHRERREETGAGFEFDAVPVRAREGGDEREGWQRVCRATEGVPDLSRRVVVLRRGLDVGWDVTSFVADRMVPATRSVYYRTRDLIPEP